MKNCVIACVIALASGALWAQENARLSPEELKAQRAERRIKAMNETGGFIADSREASGTFLFVNAQKTVPSEDLCSVVAKCQNSCMVLMRIEDGEPVTCETARAAYLKTKANLVTFIVESPSLPASLQCPEERWSIINVAALKKDGPSADVLASRVRKMMSRAVGMMFQSGYSVSPMSTMRIVNSPSELDKIPSEGLATDCQTVVQQMAPKFGFTVMKRVLYRKALEEGWAPEPVTEIQKNCKALWEQQRKGAPTDPMKITFDPNQGGQVK